MKKQIKLLALVALIAGGTWLVFALRPNEEKIIQRRLEELARAASFRAGESPLVALGAVQTLRGFFTADVSIRARLGSLGERTVEGLDELTELIAGARQGVAGADFKFTAARVEVAADHESAVVLSALQYRLGAERSADACDLRFTLRKIDGRWRIAKVETVELLN